MKERSIILGAVLAAGLWASPAAAAPVAIDPGLTTATALPLEQVWHRGQPHRRHVYRQYGYPYNYGYPRYRYRPYCYGYPYYHRPRPGFGLYFGY